MVVVPFWYPTIYFGHNGLVNSYAVVSLTNCYVAIVLCASDVVDGFYILPDVADGFYNCIIISQLTWLCTFTAYDHLFNFTRGIVPIFNSTCYFAASVCWYSRISFNTIWPLAWFLGYMGYIQTSRNIVQRIFYVYVYNNVSPEGQLLSINSINCMHIQRCGSICMQGYAQPNSICFSVLARKIVRSRKS